MTSSHPHESLAIKIGRCVAVPLRVEAAFWRLFVREGQPRLLGLAVKWSVRAVVALVCAYFLMPLLLVMIASVAAVYLMGGVDASTSKPSSSTDDHCFFEEEGLRDGLFGHGHYDKDGNRW